nr:hypothetical protein [Pseudomonas hunanensis]
MFKHGYILYRHATAQTTNHATNALIELDPQHTVKHAWAWRLGMYMQATHIVTIKVMKQQDLVDLFVTQPAECPAKAPEHAVSIGPLTRLLAPQSPSASTIVT